MKVRAKQTCNVIVRAKNYRLKSGEDYEIPEEDLKSIPEGYVTGIEKVEEEKPKKRKKKEGE